MKLPTQTIEPGFYYHYKHDPVKSIDNYAYEVLGIGVNTEDDCPLQDANMVIYRPLYSESSIYTAGKHFWIRPIDMWGDVTKEGKTFSRFTKITDQAIIAKLQNIREQMY